MFNWNLTASELSGLSDSDVCSQSFYRNLHVLSLLEQCLGNYRSTGRRPVSAQDLSPNESIEVGPFHAGTAEAAGCADEDHGQCGHLLHAAYALHFHLQVSLTAVSLKV